MNTLRGSVHKVGADVDTDAIIATPYLQATDPAEFGRHCLEGVDLDFPSRVAKGDILVALENFGIGSSREQAVLAIAGCGLSCVVAVSFSRLFFRNAINIGLPLVECAEAATEACSGDTFEVDLSAGVVRNITKHRTYVFSAYPPFIMRIVETGGLIPYARSRLESGCRKVFSG